MTKEEKERLERFTLAAMQGFLANPAFYNFKEEPISQWAVSMAREQIKKLDEVK